MKAAGQDYSWSSRHDKGKGGGTGYWDGTDFHAPRAPPAKDKQGDDMMVDAWEGQRLGGGSATSDLGSSTESRTLTVWEKLDLPDRSK